MWELKIKDFEKYEKEKGLKVYEDEDFVYVKDLVKDRIVGVFTYRTALKYLKEFMEVYKRV